MTPAEIKDGLKNFWGTSQWYRFGIPFNWVLMTDGAKFVADECEAYWLMGAIASWIPELAKKRQVFQVWKLTVKDGKGLLVCEDGNYNQIAKQEIPFTDFPLDSIELWCENSGENWIILLPTEH